ncbi:transcriptional activator CMR1 [Fusarium pseudocircinatum]|uniref:Transcriptional activator CMR1 n=1 Tax=Fusarium pseudocircinatum TaxID=56676 RepID=A0A8H5KRX9_9HYPO|nr:transcriptional activator CMR1 [Fusarium pseudocircinatum]
MICLQLQIQEEEELAMRVMRIRQSVTSSSGSKSPSEDITADPRTVANGFTSPALIQNLTPGTPQISPNDEIKAGFKRIANHVRSGEIPIGEDTPVPALDKNWIEGNSKEYFGRFHDTWPILHGPSYVTMDTSLLVSVSIAMISCWLRSPDEFEDVVLQLHESLMSAFSDWIANPRSRHEYDEPWPFETYQAILMNIIFAFYHGNEKLVSKASLLRGTFVVALREAEFFNSDNAAEQQRLHYPGTFVPWLMTIRDRWKRLIVSLFKIDTYLSIARFQAPTLFREEIDLTMPATHSLWNAYGLNIFFKRITLEPTDRSNFKLSEVIANPNTPAKSLLLFEDIHLALCGLLPAIWNQTQIVRRSTEAGRSTQNCTSSLAWQLEAWKADIERLKHQCFHAAEVGEFPFTAYIGDYDEDPVRAKALAMSNIRCLISECLMTYHLQGLQLYADPRMINSVAMASIVSPDHEAGKVEELYCTPSQFFVNAKPISKQMSPKPNPSI